MRKGIIQRICAQLLISYIMLACQSSVMPDVIRDDATVGDIHHERPDMGGVTDAVLDVQEMRDAATDAVIDVVTDQPSFDLNDAGLCDPRRVRARNSGRVCWPRNPGDPQADCPGAGYTCQHGVCCSGELDPVTCDCRCPGNNPCHEIRGIEETRCCRLTRVQLPDVPITYGCSNYCEYSTLAEERWGNELLSRRDR